MALRKGGAAAKEAAKAQAPSFKKAEFFNLKEDGDFTFLRFIDDADEWPFTNMHSYVPTRGPAKEWDDDRKGKYPSHNGAVCRYDEAFIIDEEAGTRKYDDCFICDNMRKKDNKPYTAPVRLWARAIVRKPVKGTEAMVEVGKITANKVGKTVAYVDELVDVEESDKDGKPTGKKVKQPRIVVVNMGGKNFFNALQGYAQAFEGTVCHVDFKVTREGTGTDTMYTINSLAETPGFDLGDPETKAKYLAIAPDLEKLIEDRATDDYYQYFFDTRVPHPERKKADDEDGEDDDKPVAKKSASKAAAADDEDEAPAKAAENAVDPDRLKDMANRVRGRNGAKKVEPAPESAPAAAEDESSDDGAASADESEDQFSGMAFTG